MKPTLLATLAQTLGIPCASSTLIRGVAIDSRKVQKGDLFFALAGKKVDGHAFLGEVAAAGAVAAVVSQEYKGESFGLELLFVENVLEALQKLGRVKLEGCSAQVVAITGSIGKTTTKEFTKHLLCATLKVSATPLSYNTDITLPLSVLQSDGDEDVIVLEMGIARPGEMETLVALAPPDIALLTTIAIQHASNFPDGLVGIAREKKKIFSHPKTRLGILPANFAQEGESGNCPKITFSTTQVADYELTFLKEDKIKITSPEKEEIVCDFHLPLQAYAHNLLGAVVIARALGVPWEKIQERIATLTSPPMRFEKIEKQGIVFINDAYNANPDSMKVALQNLPTPKNGKTIAVLSEMNALGMYTESGHAHIAEIALAHADILLSIGPFAEPMQKIWEKEKREAHHFTTKEALLACLKKIVQAGDVVLLKGARAHSLETLLQHF